MIRRLLPLLLIFILLVAPASAAVTRTWNQSATSSALSGCMDENYTSITCPDFNTTAPWSQMGRVVISGQTMVHVPKFWYRVDNVTIGGMHLMNFSVSAVPLSGYSVHPWFIINNTIIPEQYIGAYEGSIYNVTSGTYVGDPASVNSQPGGDRLASVAGQKPLSGLGKASLTIAGFRNMSHNIGVGWELQSFNGVSAVQLLYIVEKGNWNSQTIIGTGVTQITDDGSTNMAIPTGLTAGIGANSTDCGNFTCSVATVHYQTHQNTNQVSYRGWEGSWGNLWEGVDGINIMANRNPWISNYGFASDVFTTPYIDTSLTLPSSNGYISNLVYSSGFNYGFLPSSVAGSSSTYITDGFFQSTGNRIAYLGGGFTSTTNAGLFAIYAADASTYASRFYGSRLAYTPPVVANFTYTNTSAAFTFTDESYTISTLTGLTGTPTSWNWTFGDGSISTEQNPKHTYAAAGTYNVNLTVSDGTNYATKIESVTLSTFPVAQFTPTGPQSRIAPAYMKWNQTSTNGPVTCLWQFGDGTSSTLCNVTHFYPLPGDYPVAFTAMNAAGSSSNKTHVRVRLS